MNCPNCNQPMLIADGNHAAGITYACPNCLIFADEQTRADVLEAKIAYHIIELERVIEEVKGDISEYDEGYRDAVETEKNFLEILLGNNDYE